MERRTKIHVTLAAFTGLHGVTAFLSEPCLDFKFPVALHGKPRVLDGAAGVVGAYALKHRLVKPDEIFSLRQGHFINRPSEIAVTAYGTPDCIEHVTVAGCVSFVGSGKVVAP